MKLVGALAGAALCAALSAGTAYAADLSQPYVAPPPAAPTWSGFYAGIHGGGGWGSQNPNTPATFGIAGPYVGAHVGYDWQTSSGLVLGLEASTSWTGINGVRVTSGPGGTTTETINWLNILGGRVGWLMGSGSWMPYVTGGWAFATATRTNSSVGGQTYTASHSGWALGIGVEKQFAPHWTVNAEYKYVNLGSASYNWPTLPTTASLTVQTVELGLSYHF